MTTTNISNSNNGAGTNRLRVTQGGLGNYGTVGSNQLMRGTGVGTLSFVTGPSTGGGWTVTSGTVNSISTNPVYFVQSGSTSISIPFTAGYVVTAGTLVTLTLPASITVGQQIKIQGQGAGGWKLQAASGDTIIYGTTSTSAGGSLSSSNRYDSIHIIGIVSNTTWAVVSSLSSGLTVL
jgi:hypothetical protein